MGSMPDLAGFLNQIAVVWALAANTWWLFAPPALWYAAKNSWRYYLKVRYFSSLEWVLLEVKIPRDVSKTPEAMEQVFAGLQGMYWGFDPWEIWWQGLQHDYAVFELVSIGGQTRFFVRIPAFYRNAVESQVYAQYPEAEVAEAEDYMAGLPKVIPNEEWDIFGVEFKLEKPDAYPIRTYREFLSLAAGKEEFEKVDPFASMVELMGRLRPGEHIGYHLLIRPAQEPSPEYWKVEGEKLVAKLLNRKIQPKKGRIAKTLEPLAPLASGWGEPLRNIAGMEPEEPAEAKREERPMAFVPPDIEEQVKAIVRNISKPGFETVVRFTYAARRDAFSLSHVSSFVGALKTYNTMTLNGFKFNAAAMATKIAWWLPSFMTRGKKLYKKRLYYDYYRRRKPFVDTWTMKSARIVLNTEELATIYHYPGQTAKAPLMPRIEARRSMPPATLPVG